MSSNPFTVSASSRHTTPWVYFRRARGSNERHNCPRGSNIQGRRASANRALEKLFDQVYSACKKKKYKAARELFADPDTVEEQCPLLDGVMDYDVMGYDYQGVEESETDGRVTYTLTIVVTYKLGGAGEVFAVFASKGDSYLLVSSGM